MQLRIIRTPPNRVRWARRAPRLEGGWLRIIAFPSVLAGSAALLFILWILARPLALLVGALILALALAPAVSRLQRWIPRSLAILLVYATVLATVVWMGWVSIPALAEQAVQIANSAPQFVARWQQQLGTWHLPTDGPVLDFAQSRLLELSGRLVGLPFLLVSSALEIVLVIIMSVYWLIVFPPLHEFMLSLFPEERRPHASEVLHAMGRSMGGYVRGVVINAAVVGSIVYVGLLVMGLDYPLVLALVAMLGEMVPILGPFLAAVPALGIALLDSPHTVLVVAGFYLAVQQLEGHLLTPNIMRAQTNIPPLLVIFALLAGSTVGGILGALLAIPTAGALYVFVREVVIPAVRGAIATHPSDGHVRLRRPPPGKNE
jgi:putative heme transporter